MGARVRQLESWGYRAGKKFEDIICHLDTIHQRHGQTDTGRQQRPRLRIARAVNDVLKPTRLTRGYNRYRAAGFLTYSCIFFSWDWQHTSALDMTLYLPCSTLAFCPTDFCQLWPFVQLAFCHFGVSSVSRIFVTEYSWKNATGIL